jgi:hypothetical protein
MSKSTGHASEPRIPSSYSRVGTSKLKLIWWIQITVDHGRWIFLDHAAHHAREIDAAKYCWIFFPTSVDATGDATVGVGRNNQIEGGRVVICSFHESSSALIVYSARKQR